MPVSDAGFRLPDVGRDFIGEAALEIGDNCFDQVSRHILDVGDYIHLASSLEQAVIVKIGGNIHSGPTEREHRIVEIEDVGIVLVDEISGSIVESSSHRKGRGGRRRGAWVRKASGDRIPATTHAGLDDG